MADPRPAKIGRQTPLLLLRLLIMGSPVRSPTSLVGSGPARGLRRSPPVFAGATRGTVTGAPARRPAPRRRVPAGPPDRRGGAARRHGAGSPAAASDPNACITIAGLFASTPMAGAVAPVAIDMTIAGPTLRGPIRSPI